MNNMKGDAEKDRLVIAGEVVYEGHSIVVHSPEGTRKWKAMCTCGYESVLYIREGAASDSAIHHAYKVKQSRVANGAT